MSSRFLLEVQDLTARSSIAFNELLDSQIRSAIKVQASRGLHSYTFNGLLPPDLIYKYRELGFTVDVTVSKNVIFGW